jgi:hypothetical protein
VRLSKIRVVVPDHLLEQFRAAHADEGLDGRRRHLDPRLVKRTPPSQCVEENGVDESPVKVEK